MSGPPVISIGVAEVLTHGRDEHPAFGKRWNPDGPLLRSLSRYQQQLFQMILDIEQDVVVTEYVVTMPLASFPAGDNGIPDYLSVHGGRVVFTDTNLDDEHFDLVVWNNRLDRYRFKWGGYLRADVLFLLGRAEDWTEVGSIVLDYVPAVVALTTRNSPLSLPGDALDVMAARVAYQIAKRLPKGEVDVGEFRGLWERAESYYVDQVTGRRRARVGRTRETW